MAVMTHANFYFIRLKITLIFGIQASEPRARRTTEKAGLDRVKVAPYNVSAATCNRLLFPTLRDK